MSDERRKILGMVESGQITAEEAASLLDLVSDEQPEDADQAQAAQTALDAPEVGQLASAGRRHYWYYPLAAGSVAVLLGGTVIASAQPHSRAGATTWLCGWIPLFVGLATVTVAVWARTAHWIHLRIVDRDDRVTVSLPLPLGITALVLRAIRPFVPSLRETAVDEVILAVQEGLTEGQPLTIEVEDEEAGEHVQICIG
jgi:hypothetical protein